MRSAAAVIMFLLSATALAHPGHGISSLWHLLTEPDHLALIVMPVVVGGVLWLYARRKR
jgi:hydrogenase/urease accessory protein HupE